MKAFIRVRAMLLGATAIVALAQTARADLGGDQKACNDNATAVDLRIATCTRQIESGKWEGHDLAVSYSNRAIAYEAKGDYDQAIADYSKAIEINPKVADLLHNRALDYRYKGDLVSAMADYTQEIQVDPKLWRAYFSRGTVSVMIGALPPAMADLNRAAELAPRNAYIPLWIEIANKRGNSASRLADATKQVDMANWPGPVINFYLGQLTSEALLAAANSGDATQRTKQTCAANFYIGELALQQGKTNDATRQFRIAADTSCRIGPLEYSSAHAELKALGAN